MAKAKDESKEPVSRRGFLRGVAATAAGVSAAGAVKTAHAAPEVYKRILPQTVIGANEKVYTAHIGTGGMGRADLKFCLMRDDVQPIALCDLYARNLERGAQMLSSKFKEFSRHKDFREVLENKDVDAVVIATPDHWHALCTLYAADAGKAIYCEKPLSTTIVEGRAMVEAVRRNKVVFQGGTMQRSAPHFIEAVQLVRDGHIGQVGRIDTFNHETQSIEGIGQGEDDQKKYEEMGLDWDFHQGWVEHRPFNTNRWIYHFRWFLEYSGGKITDWGAHLIDIALWAMGEEKQPKSVVASGAKLILTDNRTTPDTLEAIWQYDDYMLTFGNRVWNGYLPQGYTDHGILFHGTLGTLRVDRGGYEVYSVPNNGGCETKKYVHQGDPEEMNHLHWENFIDCIRTGKDPVVTVECLHNTTRTCHMGTCSYIADGAKLAWDAEKERFTGEGAAVDQANDWAYRKYLNGWSLEAPYDRRKA